MKGEAVTRHRLIQGGPDRYGKPSRSYSPSTVTGVAVAPDLGSDGTTLDRDSATNQTTIYVPPATDVRTDDEFTVRGKRYRVVGQPADWWSPFTGSNPGIVVKLERTEDTNG